MNEPYSITHIPHAPAYPRASARYVWPIMFLLAHIPLAIAMRSNSMLATAHVMLTLLAGCYVVMQRARTERVMIVCAYIAGSEVLWRMGGASVFWEAGKYAISGFMFISIYRSRRLTVPALAVAFFVLLLPSCAQVFLEQSMSNFRNEVSYNLSGPFALMACVWFFSRLSITRDELYQMFFVVIGPVVGVAGVAAFRMVTAEQLAFKVGSNYQTSGGYGPNQVSSVLGLGAMLIFLYLQSSRGTIRLRLVMFAAMVYLGIQSALTFSRGGLFNAIGSSLVAVPFLLSDSRRRVQFILTVVPLYLLTVFVILPRLEEYTGGAIAKRFTSTNTTGRADIMEGEIELWERYPVFGVGPGQATTLRSTMKGVSAHTEFTRLLAEHGAFGITAILLLGVMAVYAVMRAPTSLGKAVAMACVTWALLYMTNAAMRLAAPAFIFGLAFATIEPDEPRPGLKAFT